jgi:hypothetical protein
MWVIIVMPRRLGGHPKGGMFMHRHVWVIEEQIGGQWLPIDGFVTRDVARRTMTRYLGLYPTRITKYVPSQD